MPVAVADLPMQACTTCMESLPHSLWLAMRALANRFVLYICGLIWQSFESVAEYIVGPNLSIQANQVGIRKKEGESDFLQRFYLTNL